MNNYEIVKCTRCGREFKDFRIYVALNIITDRITELGIFERIPNLTQTTKEYLCQDCFNRLCDIFEMMNSPMDEKEKEFMEQHSKNPLESIMIVRDNDNINVQPKQNEHVCDCNCVDKHDDKDNPVLKYVKVVDDVKYVDEKDAGV